MPEPIPIRVRLLISGNGRELECLVDVRTTDQEPEEVYKAKVMAALEEKFGPGDVIFLSRWTMGDARAQLFTEVNGVIRETYLVTDFVNQFLESVMEEDQCNQQIYDL